MAITTVGTRIWSLVTTKDMGLPNGFGEVYFGWSQFGDNNQFSGTYSRRKAKKGPVISRMRHMWPTNPQTGPQQSRRTVFALAVENWHLLTTEEKSAYNIEASKVGITGYNLFISQYLKEYA